MFSQPMTSTEAIGALHGASEVADASRALLELADAHRRVSPPKLPNRCSGRDASPEGYSPSRR